MRQISRKRWPLPSDPGECFYCNTQYIPGKTLFLFDHLVPISRGGFDVERNLVLCCHCCNAAKVDRLPSEWLTTPPQRALDLESTLVAEMNPRPYVKSHLRKPVDHADTLAMWKAGHTLASIADVHEVTTATIGARIQAYRRAGLISQEDEEIRESISRRKKVA